MRPHRIVLFIYAYLTELVVECSRILVVVPTPLLSHQLVFRPFTQELARQGHDVVVLTTDPAFPPGQTPPNLIEIRLHKISNKIWKEGFQKAMTGKERDYKTQVQIAYEIMFVIFQKQMQAKEVKEMLADKSQQFDLVIIEAWVNQALALAHVYNAAAILMSTFGIADEINDYDGVPIDPIFPDVAQTRRHSHSLWEQARILSNRVALHHMVMLMEKRHDIVLRRIFGEDMPPLQDLMKRVEFVNMHPVWGLPLDVVNEGINYVPPKTLAQDLQEFMDSSEHGVIYMSFAPPERLEVFSRVFSSLPYDVLWRGKDAPKNISINIRTFAWQPQPDLLQHDKLVLFITQGELQSTNEALRAGVPLLGIPLLIDQWLNTENYERLGVGMQLDLLTLSEEALEVAIETLIKDNSYRERSGLMGMNIQDKPLIALAHAVWEVERVLQLHGRRVGTPSNLTRDHWLYTSVFLLTALIVSFVFITIAVLLYKIRYCVDKMENCARECNTF